MRQILLDGKEIETLVPESLPMLLHGIDGSGASFYTICLAAKWFSQGYKVLVLCGYKMAEEAFRKEVGSVYANVNFFTKEKVDEFIEKLGDISNDTIVIVKNIELFDIRLFDAVKKIDQLIISGEIDQTVFKIELLSKKFVTEILFSPLDGKELVQLDKFAGYYVSGDYKGITELR